MAPGDPASVRLSEQEDNLRARLAWSNGRKIEVHHDRTRPHAPTALALDPRAHDPRADRQHLPENRACQLPVPLPFAVPTGVGCCQRHCRGSTSLRLPRSCNGRQRLDAPRTAVECSRRIVPCGTRGERRCRTSGQRDSCHRNAGTPQAAHDVIVTPARVTFPHAGAGRALLTGRGGRGRALAVS